MNKRNISVNSFILNTYYDYNKIMELENIEIINITEKICDDHYCRVYFNNTCLYLDRHHIKSIFYTSIHTKIIALAKSICNIKRKTIDMTSKFINYKDKMHRRWHLRKKKCRIISLPVLF